MVKNEFNVTPLISIIVPVYNSEKTLDRCINSILEQTFHDWELLLINDGSTDNSKCICDIYAAKDKRIKVFHKVNGGVGSARNIGIDKARGIWITFVDSDDEICDGVFNLLSSYNEDLVIFDYFIKEHDGKLFVSPKIVQYNLNEMLKKYIDYEVFRTPWGKFFKRYIVSDLRFDLNLKIGEDTLFVLQYLRRCSSIKYINKDYYVWYRPEKALNEKYRLSVSDSVNIVCKLYESYYTLEIKSIKFERFIYDFFLWLCSVDMNKNAHLWYINNTIYSIWKDIRQYYSIRRRISFLVRRIRLLYIFRWRACKQ